MWSRFPINCSCNVSSILWLREANNLPTELYLQPSTGLLLLLLFCLFCCFLFCFVFTSNPGNGSKPQVAPSIVPGKECVPVGGDSFLVAERIAKASSLIPVLHADGVNRLTWSLREVNRKAKEHPTRTHYEAQKEQAPAREHVGGPIMDSRAGEENSSKPRAAELFVSSMKSSIILWWTG
ncbi:hypothetical protein H1C71_001336 [Ictidomys tridecemlineatus]|nr:hypothetical protein H1C71_001336 [Ictidomys tridecemlineatus]